MGLIVQRQRVVDTTPRKMQMCWKCRERKAGLFTVDPNGRPVCAGCSGRNAPVLRGTDGDAS